MSGSGSLRNNNVNSDKNPGNRRIWFVVVFFVVLIIIGGILVNKFIEHERGQGDAIASLQAQVGLLTEKLTDRPEAAEFVSKVTEDGYDYLAIGNSITQHGVADFWWGIWGMAASEEKLDYYHRVVDGIKNVTGTDINTIAYNYTVWEVQSNDRMETYEFLDNYLADDIDLVTIQLSENAIDINTFEKDYVSLINHIREKCDGAQVIIIDDFWSDEKSRLKIEIAEEAGADFIDLSDIRGDAQYQAGIGAVVSGEDGERHTIEHNGVAAHPGDKGMEAIAERVLEKVEY